MAIQDNQLSELNLARMKVAQLRTERLTQREVCFHDIQTIDLALSRLENRSRILAIERTDCETSAKSLTGAWLGVDMPETIRVQVNEKAAELTTLDSEIEKLSRSREQLTRDRKDKNGAYRLAQEDLEKVEAELRQVDQRIAEIRGF